MSYMRNEAMIISGTKDSLTPLRDEVFRLFAKRGSWHGNYGGLVSDVIDHCVNGTASFFIAPDGFKEGWEPSNVCAGLRGQVIELLNEFNEADGVYFEWALILLGGDNSEYSILQHSAG
jgi:hypothetical protein